jgi:hypothetical protein
MNWLADKRITITGRCRLSWEICSEKAGAESKAKRVLKGISL